MEDQTRALSVHSCMAPILTIYIEGNIQINQHKNALHTCKTCWKLHRKPKNWKKKPSGYGRALQVSNTDQGQQTASEMLHFTKDQLEHLYKLLQFSSFIVNSNPSPSCSLT